MKNYWIGIRYRQWIEQAYFDQSLSESTSNQPTSPRACVITQPKPPFKVIATNPVAIAFGIQQQMNLASAEALAPGLLTAPHDQERESRYLQQCCEEWQHLSPHIYGIAPDTVLIDVTNCLELWGGKTALLAKIQEQRLTAVTTTRIAFGFTPLSVRAALGTKNDNQPASLLIDASPEQVSQLTIDSLQPDSDEKATPSKKKRKLSHSELLKFKQQLTRMGLKTIGDIFQIDKDELASAFHTNILFYLERFCGDSADPQTARPITHHFETVIHIEPPIEDSQQLSLFFKKALEQLQPLLYTHQLATTQVQTVIKDECGNTHSLDIGARQKTANLSYFLQLFELQLARLKMEHPITSLHVEIPQLADISPTNASLWPDETHTQTLHARSQLLDKLQHRLGPLAVQILTHQEHHTPELNWKTIAPDPFTAASSANTNMKPRKRRPHFLFDTPQPADIGSLECYFGPEKITLLSWLKPETRRYHMAKCAKNTHYWIYQTSDEAWYIHGIFA